MVGMVGMLPTDIYYRERIKTLSAGPVRSMPTMLTMPLHAAALPAVPINALSLQLGEFVGLNRPFLPLRSGRGWVFGQFATPAGRNGATCWG